MEIHNSPVMARTPRCGQHFSLGVHVAWAITWWELWARWELCTGMEPCSSGLLCSGFLSHHASRAAPMRRGEQAYLNQCLCWTRFWNLFSFQLCCGCVKSLEDANYFCWHTITHQYVQYESPAIFFFFLNQHCLKFIENILHPLPSPFQVHLSLCHQADSSAALLR